MKEVEAVVTLTIEVVMTVQVPGKWDLDDLSPKQDEKLNEQLINLLDGIGWQYPNGVENIETLTSDITLESLSEL